MSCNGYIWLDPFRNSTLPDVVSALTVEEMVSVDVPVTTVVLDGAVEVVGAFVVDEIVTAMYYHHYIIKYIDRQILLPWISSNISQRSQGQASRSCLQTNKCLTYDYDKNSD